MTEEIKGIDCNPHLKTQKVLPTEKLTTKRGIQIQENETTVYFKSSEGKELGTWKKTAIFDLTALTNTTILDTFQLAEGVTQEQRFDIIETLAEHKTRIAIGRINDFLQLKGDNRLSQEGGKLYQIGAELVLGSPKSQYLVLRKNPNAPKIVSHHESGRTSQREVD